MGSRILWVGDRNPLTDESMEEASKVWITAGDYTVVNDDGKCYVDWGNKRILAITPVEHENGKWALVLRQNPSMKEFPDAVMDGYAQMLRPVTIKLTQTSTSPSPQ